MCYLTLVFGSSSRVPQLTCTWMSGASGLGNLTRQQVQEKLFWYLHFHDHYLISRNYFIIIVITGVHCSVRRQGRVARGKRTKCNNLFPSEANKLRKTNNQKIFWVDKQYKLCTMQWSQAWCTLRWTLDTGQAVQCKKILPRSRVPWISQKTNGQAVHKCQLHTCRALWTTTSSTTQDEVDKGVRGSGHAPSSHTRCILQLTPSHHYFDYYLIMFLKIFVLRKRMSKNFNTPPR